MQNVKNPTFAISRKIHFVTAAAVLRWHHSNHRPHEATLIAPGVAKCGHVFFIFSGESIHDAVTCKRPGIYVEEYLRLKDPRPHIFLPIQALSVCSRYLPFLKITSEPSHLNFSLEGPCVVAYAVITDFAGKRTISTRSRPFR